MVEIKKQTHKILAVVENSGLIVIAIATVISVVQEVLGMIDRQTVALADLLLLFIYLEVLTMVAMYLDSGELPVRMPMYIAIVALARYLILDMKGMDSLRIIAVASGMLIMSLTILIVRYGHCRFPYLKRNKETE